MPFDVYSLAIQSNFFLLSHFGIELCITKVHLEVGSERARNEQRRAKKFIFISLSESRKIWRRKIGWMTIVLGSKKLQLHRTKSSRMQALENEVIKNSLALCFTSMFIMHIQLIHSFKPILTHVFSFSFSTTNRLLLLLTNAHVLCTTNCALFCVHAHV